MAHREGGTTGKPFVKGDPRIKPGPGRPPLWWRHEIARYEKSAVDLLGALIEDGRERLRKSGKDGIRRVHLSAAQDVLDRLHGKPTQPVEVVPSVDLSHLTDKELDDFNRLLDRIGILPHDGSARHNGHHRKVSSPDLSPR